MGSGCNTNSPSQNYFQKLIPDTGVQYTGPAIPALHICTGDLLSEVEATVLQAIINYSTGAGITLNNIDLTTCQAFASCITCCNNNCKDLPCLLECYKTAICTIWGDVQTLETQMQTLFSGPYNTACLSIPTNSPLNVIVQELITEFCNLLSAFNVLNASVSGFTSGIGTTIGNFLSNALTSCQGNGVLGKTGSGSSVNFAFKGFVPVGAIIPYAGAISGKFDGSGLGIAGTDCCGFALCNGNNGTVNMMGQVPVGLTNMGGSLPANASGLSVTAIGAQIGETSHVLVAGELPSAPVSVTINDPGHDHGIEFAKGSAVNGDGTTTFNPLFTGSHSNYHQRSGTTVTSIPASDSSIHFYVYSNQTGITATAALAGGGNAHNNVQPSTGVYYIQRIS